jgi:ribosomal protein S10
LLPAAAIAGLFAIATAGLLVFRNSGGREPLVSHWQTTKDPLLEQRAVEEVETAERTYLASIENLSRVARPRLAGATSSVLMNYREKLDVLDSAIAELKSSIEQNRYNTHLRRELLAIYKEKQQTLQSLMKEVKS